MPAAMVNMVLCRHQAAADATSAAMSLMLPSERSRTLGAENTIAGTTIAVSPSNGR